MDLFCSRRVSSVAYGTHFSLWDKPASRSFALMRVESVESLAVRAPPHLTAIDDAAVHRGLRNFSTAIASDDSLFACEILGSVAIGRAGGEEVTCAGDFALRFRETNLVDNRALNFSMLEKLCELLRQAGSADSLAAYLSLSPQAGPDTKPGAFVLRLRLEAKGNSSEQAALRWELGLAHLQQAVLFASRYLRQQLARNTD